jgi:hypothetical protein
MLEFILQANIAHYKELLATETDTRKITTIRKLLAEEQAKLAQATSRDLRSNADSENPPQVGDSLSSPSSNAGWPSVLRF